MINTILVNATSLGSGGALTIINEYISNLLRNKESDKKYYVFIADSCSLISDCENVILIKNGENFYYKGRNHWNSIGMKRWCKANNIENFEIYSMQNYLPFGFSSSKIKKSVYIHQPIPFFNYKWSFFKKSERTLWFYKNVYIKFIKSSVKKANKVYVQTEWFKKQIIDKMKINDNKIEIIRPKITRINERDYNVEEDIKGKLKLFYPANECVYKNHEVLYKAMNVIVNKYGYDDVMLYITIDKKNKIANRYIKKYNLNKNIIMVGKLNYSEVMSMYKSTDILVFPSKIETFGLPLIEAQAFKMKIIASDLELYKEVIGSYIDVKYCDIKDYKMWADTIMSAIQIK